MDMRNLLFAAVEIFIGDTTTDVYTHEDNAQSLIMTQTISSQFTPWIKQYYSKDIWFCEEIHKHGVKLKKIATMEQQ